MSWEGSDAVIWDAERRRIATDAAGVGLWSWNMDTDEIAMDDHGRSLWGVSKNAPLTFADLSSRITPPDRDQVRTAFAATRTTTGSYQIDFRILHEGDIRWLSARGRGADEGSVERVRFGVFIDSTKQMRLNEDREMLAKEMNHRIKNLFAIAAGLTSIAARSTATTTEMARDLTQRLMTLGRAHDLIRPLPGAPSKAVPLCELCAVLLAPYDEKLMIGNRIRVSMPEVRVGETAATTVALIVHELATNSVKYGSLSVDQGTVDVSCAEDDDEVVVVWTERSGPRVSVPTGAGGFGSTLLTRGLSQQLGGSITYKWPSEGVVITLKMRRSRLSI